ncbi:ParB/RepB/Spo0J family partition protein [Variovorax fucosicus]|uniref:ParB/RepB/Spo0J family partition protein n=1 Tax=Variovorax fucosicus TaxID=3053517 RepID=UPI002576E1AD|nr:ParB/RepB/Spo0J family partition protein [Variovorax sp. J22G47]MDM0058938.1 ParB N-terminal domain-containing protein [Variovorax sp. J22G47]
MTVIAKPIKPEKNVASRAHKPGKKAPVAQVAVSVAVEPTGRDVRVPLDRLFISEANVRKVHHAAGLAELAALIEAQGLLHRLSVVAQPDGRFAVVAGGRRLRAMQMLAESGRWPASQPVECKLYDEGQAVQVSLAENSGREAMHPADQMAAFKRLIDEGLTTAQVADRFEVSPLTVARRLKLARLAPRFLDLYRADEIEPDQLQALALIEDHTAQEAVWDGLGVHDRSAWRIRSIITAEACSADSRLARFVGLDQYEAEGGTVRRDLFSSPEDLGGIFLDNPSLLQTLAMEKLRGLAAAIKEEGWSWVEGSLDTDTTALRGHGRVDRERRAPTPEEAQVLEALSAEQRACMDACDAHQDEGDPDAEDFDQVEQQLSDGLEAVEEKLEAASAVLWQWLPERLAIAGALIRVDSRGHVQIERGLVRPADRQALSAGTEGNPGEDDESAPRDQPTPARPEFSEKLMRDLTSHRTAAIQAALVQNPHIALVTLVHRMAETVFGLYGAGDDVVKVTVRTMGDGALAQDASDYAASPAATLLGAAETQWGDRLPGSPAALFQWLLAQPDSTLLELLAYCTARSVNAVAARPRSANHSDALAEALGVDMADWWVPTAACYLNSVSKAKALEAVKEATGVNPMQATAGMKKAEVVAYCASKLEGTRWLPSPLRVKGESGDAPCVPEDEAADD